MTRGKDEVMEGKADLLNDCKSSLCKNKFMSTSSTCQSVILSAKERLPLERGVISQGRTGRMYARAQRQCLTIRQDGQMIYDLIFR